MLLVSALKTFILLRVDSNEKRLALLVSSVLMLIVMTPLCGLLFQCGCDWPWLGLDSKCNYYQAHAKHQCPWCASMISGVLMIGFAGINGLYWSSRALHGLARWPFYPEVSVRIVIALSVFVLLAILMAGLAARWQVYPLGMGGYVNV